MEKRKYVRRTIPVRTEIGTMYTPMPEDIKRKMMLEWVAKSARKLVNEQGVDERRAVMSYLLRAPSEFFAPWPYEHDELVFLASGGIKSIQHYADEVRVDTADLPPVVELTSADAKQIIVVKDAVRTPPPPPPVKLDKPRKPRKPTSKRKVLSIDEWCEQARKRVQEFGFREAALSKRNTSGYRGVVLHRGTNRWKAQITVGKEVRHLGIYDTAEQAYARYLEIRNKVTSSCA